MSENKTLTLLGAEARIGILNRGEPACRFIRSVKEYNNLYSCSLKNIAFYIGKEEDSLFVRNSDEAYLLDGNNGERLSGAGYYLDHDLLISELKRAECTAVWVGWGFVSEDSVFAEKINDEGIVFLGPSSRSMRLLGDKITAKELAEKSDVPVLPWSRKSVGSLQEAEKISSEIGYPVIIKASNAGGGRGIRVVETPDQLASRYKSALEETIRITGNDILFIECFVAKGRHLEVQVIADYHGNINTLGVRDCSVQRNNQKIIEETPPPLLDEDIMKKMEEASYRLMKISGYTGAGTVEYLYDLERKQFYFMEVNTRLQVEHPITEILYGFDLVKGQIDVAMGKEVVVDSKKSAGAVIEVRLNAEDPYSNFSPSPGEVLLFVPPAGPGIRVDSGIEQNSSIPSDFDSMVAKVIAYGSERGEALARIKRAVEELKIKIKNGTTNKAFVLELLNNREIIKGGIHTGFVKELLDKKEGEKSSSLQTEAAILASAVEIYLKQQKNEIINFKNQISKSGSPRIVPSSEGVKIDLTFMGCGYSFLVKYTGSGFYHINYLDKILICRYRTRGEESLIEFDGDKYNLILTDRGDTILCDVDGVSIPVEYQSGGILKSRSPAIVLSLNVKAGDEVMEGAPLLILEAMKMEMVITASKSGTVRELYVSEGEQISAGEPLLLIEDSGEKPNEDNKGPINFKSVLTGSDREMKREWAVREIFSPFLGHDNERGESDIFNDFSSLVFSDNDLKSMIPDLVLRLLKAYSDIEKLFISGEMETGLFSRPVTNREMLSHYFRRSGGGDNGVPEEFLEDIRRAEGYYSLNLSASGSADPSADSSSGEPAELPMMNIFKSHRDIRKKEEILKKIFSMFSSISFPDEKLDQLSIRLNEIIEHSCFLSNSSDLVNSAVNARYTVFDSKKLLSVKSETSRHLESVIERVIRSETVAESDISYLIDSGTYIVSEFINLALSGGKSRREQGLKFAGLRFNRDRKIIRTGYKSENNTDYFYTVSEGEGGGECRGKFLSYITILDEKELAGNADEGNLFSNPEGEGCRKELTVLIRSCSCSAESAEDLFEKAAGIYKLSGVQLSIGIFDNSSNSFYKTFTHSDEGREENLLMKNFSPLQFRELKVYRFSGFDLIIKYRNEGVFVAEIKSKTNQDDVRLVAFVDVSELLPSTADKTGQLRLVMIEALFNEAANAVRSLKAEYKKRLLWNRMIVHNRTLLGIKFKTLQEYGAKMMKQAGDIGLEQLTVFTRRKRWSEDFTRSVELDFKPVAGSQIMIRNKQPSELPIASLDSYTAKLLSSRRKKTVYPYEVIKLLTGSSSEELGIRSGVFEEYDIEDHRIVSAAGRAPGLNKSNIVFGVIENILVETGTSIRRVIILSDAVKDMGSLAEEESRRIIAAIDIAEKENIPVEWIPVSSGARIDMKSGTENLDWTASVLRKIIEYTQNGGEINIIVSAINVGAQSYWNAESTMLMHTKGLLIMTDNASMLLTGKKALDFSGSVSGETNTDIGGAEKIMAPNGQAQIRVSDFSEAYKVLFRHYRYTFISSDWDFPLPLETTDSDSRDISVFPYADPCGQGFETVGDIFDRKKNPDRKKPFDMRQVMASVVDSDAGFLERWQNMHDSETSIVWETQIGGIPAGLIGIESRSLSRIGEIPHDGPESWSGGTLYPMSSKKVARALNAFSGSIPAVILANLSGFDGSPESLRKLQLEYGAEIGRAVVNFKGPIVFVVVARYHGGAYVVFSKSLNSSLTVAALEGSFASVIGGAPAAAVVFPRKVLKETYADERIRRYTEKLEKNTCSRSEFDDCFKKVYNERQRELGQEFDRVHSVERARKVGSIDDIVSPDKLRPYIIGKLKGSYLL